MEKASTRYRTSSGLTSVFSCDLPRPRLCSQKYWAHWYLARCRETCINNAHAHLTALAGILCMDQRPEPRHDDGEPSVKLPSWVLAWHLRPSELDTVAWPASFARPTTRWTLQGTYSLRSGFCQTLDQNCGRPILKAFSSEHVNRCQQKSLA